MSHNTIPSALPPARRNVLDVLEDIADNTANGGGGGGGGGSDRELVVLTYSANKAFTGASLGDLITGTQIVDVTGASPVVGATIWYNQTTRLALASAPLAADVDLAGGGGGASNAQLVAALGTQTTAIKAGVVASGDIASGVADTGNPIKVGGKYTATPPTLTDGNRGDFRIGFNGAQITTPNYGVAAAADGFDNGNVRSVADATNNAITEKSASYVFNGTTWDRARGTIRGNWVEGGVASAATDSGNPVKIGGIFQTTPPTLTDGQRGNIQTDVNGNLMSNVVISAQAPGDAVATTNVAYNQTRTGLFRALINAGLVWNGASYDRMPGSTLGVAVVQRKAITVTNLLTNASGAAPITGATVAGVAAQKTYQAQVSATAGSAGAATVIIEGTNDTGSSVVTWVPIGTITLTGGSTTVSVCDGFTSSDRFANVRARVTASSGSAVVYATMSH